MMITKYDVHVIFFILSLPNLTYIHIFSSQIYSQKRGFVI